MPEAAIYEYSDSLLCEGDVGMHGPAARQTDEVVLSESESAAVQERPDHDLRLGIHSPVGAHFLR